jgi:hypothetical protein
VRHDILRLPTQEDSQERLQHFETLRQEAEQSGNEQQAQHWQEMQTIESRIYSFLGGKSERR